jgi:hypothetical protein
MAKKEKKEESSVMMARADVTSRYAALISPAV